MNKKVKIVMVGGGSVNWSPTLINDLILTPGLQDAEYVILDIDPEAGNKMVQLGRKLVNERRLGADFNYTDNPKDAYADADYVIITISTGGLDAMEHDLKIPEDYGIYQTVGDTVGPGGWARGLRNIPVFAQMAKDIEKYSNNAVVLNYTNPMSVLTKVFYRVGGLRTVGLCHGLFEVYNVLMKIFNLKSEDEIKVRFGGVNHFFWIIDMSIKGEDGYEALRRKMNGRPFTELVTEIYVDGAGFHSNKWVTSELLDFCGYLPYVADRHICEFLPFYLTGSTQKLEKYRLRRTFIEERRKYKRHGMDRLNALLAGKEKLPDKRSRETAADIIGSFVNKKEIIDVVNLPNTGQIANLPHGSIVETLGVVNSAGFNPICIGNLPEQILNLVMPHVLNQDMIVEAGLEGDLDKAFWALYNDPLCSYMILPEIKEMGMKLLKANKKYLPQFTQIL
jgi:alpha-galactosidase/6-phospho-beta-glucosidase family protein